MLPFGIWGLMMVVINTIAHQQLSQVDSPIALFNLVRNQLLSRPGCWMGCVLQQLSCNVDACQQCRCLPSFKLTPHLAWPPQINYNLVQFYRLHVFMQTLTIEPDPANMPGHRTYLLGQMSISMSDYYAMVGTVQASAWWVVDDASKRTVQCHYRANHAYAQARKPSCARCACEEIV